MCATSLVSGQDGIQAEPAGRDNHPAARPSIRVASFNIAAYRAAAGELTKEWSSGTSSHATAVARVIRTVDPDILLVSELDYEPDRAALLSLADQYLVQADDELPACPFPYRFSAAVNTGVPSGLDLDQNGKTNDPADAYGYGVYPGQYGMAVLSKFPISDSEVRTFQLFRWSEMPSALRPVHPDSGATYYDDATWSALRLSSKSHWDVPILWNDKKFHFLVCHPTPPVFDGPEDRNGRRNHDEIRLWVDYVDPERSRYLVDDQGRRGGLAPDSLFVIAGDLNADPNDGDSLPGAIAQLLEHPRIDASCIPSSRGGPAAARLQGKKNTTHRGDPSHDTADFGDGGSGNLRVDYVLPSRGWKIVGCGVLWPSPDESLHETATQASDHRMVWIDLELADE